MKKLFKWLIPVVALVLIGACATMLSACQPTPPQEAPANAVDYKINYWLTATDDEVCFTTRSTTIWTVQTSAVKTQKSVWPPRVACTAQASPATVRW